MVQEIFSIGEVAKLKGFTIKALRFYDRIGLLKPYRVDKITNYRYYHLKQFILLDIIKAARNLDISPNDLIPYFRKNDTKGMLGLLRKHREGAQEKMKLLEQVIQNINNLESTIEASENAAMKKIITRRILPARHILAKPWDNAKTPENALFDYSGLYVLADRLGVFPTYTEGVLIEIRDGQPVPSHLFLSVNSPASSDAYVQLQGGTYICVSYSLQDIEQQQARLSAYLEENRLIPLEIVQVSLLTDFFGTESEHFELQVRIENSPQPQDD